MKPKRATPTILTKQHTKLRVKQIQMPMQISPILGTGIDVMTLPEGHLSCVTCGGYKFECWLLGDSHRIEMGCPGCNSNYRLLFPLDIIMPESEGRFTCKRHPQKFMILIHNTDVISVGCESCYTELDIKLRRAEGLVIADA